MDEKQFFAQLENYRQEFVKAGETFSRKGASLSSRANNTVMHISDPGQAYRFMQEGIAITRDYFVACEAVIFAIDATAKNQMAAGMSIQALAAVAQLLGEIAKDMDGTSTTFDVHINGRSVSDASLMPKPGIQAKSTCLFWEQQYKTHPEYQKEEARKKQAEKAAKDTRKAIAAEISRQMPNNAPLQEKKDALQETCEEALEKYKAECESALEEMIASLPQRGQEESQELQATAKELRARAKKAPRQEKEALLNRANHMAAEAAVVTTEEYRLAQKQLCEEKTRQAIDAYQQALARYSQKRFSSKKVSKTFSQIPVCTPTSTKALTTIHKRILNTIDFRGWVTVNALIEDFPQHSSREFLQGLRELEEMGYVHNLQINGVQYSGTGQVPLTVTVSETAENRNAGHLPQPASLKFQKADYTDDRKKDAMVEAVLQRKQKKKLPPIAIILLLLALALIGGAFVITFALGGNTQKASPQQALLDNFQQHIASYGDVYFTDLLTDEEKNIYYNWPGDGFFYDDRVAEIIADQFARFYSSRDVDGILRLSDFLAKNGLVYMINIQSTTDIVFSNDFLDLLRDYAQQGTETESNCYTAPDGRLITISDQVVSVYSKSNSLRLLVFGSEEYRRTFYADRNTQPEASYLYVTETVETK